MDYSINTIDGFYTKLKRLTKNFSVLTIVKINSIFTNDNEKKKYLNSCLCYSLLLRKF